MKHINQLVLTFAATFVVFSASAQIQFSYGLRAGINLAKWETEELEEEGDIKNRLGLLGGAVLELRFNENFAIQPEINFLQKGVKVEYSVSDPILGNYSGSTNIYLNYLEVPVALKVGRSFGGMRADLLAGPSFGYGLNGKSKDSYTFNGVTEKDESDIDFKEDEIKRIDLGLQIGATVSFGFGENTRLFVDGRYLFGFTNIVDSGDSEDPKVYNRGIALSAGLLFPL